LDPVQRTRKGPTTHVPAADTVELDGTSHPATRCSFASGSVRGSPAWRRERRGPRQRAASSARRRDVTVGGSSAPWPPDTLGTAADRREAPNDPGPKVLPKFVATSQSGLGGLLG